MIDTRVESIIYQSQIYYRDLVNELVAKKKLGKALDHKWEKADIILGYLEALGYRDRLTDEDDILNVNYILFCLIKLCELNRYPVAAPITFQPAPAVIVGEPGESITGPPGPQGDTGLATDFQATLVSVPTTVDSFLIDDAKAARWDYFVIESTGEQRASSIIGHWTEDGLSLSLTDNGAEDIGGDTSPLVFNLQFSAGEIQLIATPSSGIWTVIGTRYFIPNNGNGAGPISQSLGNGLMYIGNNSDIAQARTISGDLTISSIGVAVISPGVIVNNDVSSTAAIALSKLAAVTPLRLAVTDASGFLTSSSIPTSSIITGTGNTNRIAFFSSGQVLTSDSDFTFNSISNELTVGNLVINTDTILGGGGLTLSAFGSAIVSAVRHDFTPGANSGLRLGVVATDPGTLGNSDLWYNSTSHTFNLRINGATESAITSIDATKAIKIKIIDINDWNMDSTAAITVAHGIADHTKIRAIEVYVRDDAATNSYPLAKLDDTATGLISGGVTLVNSVNIFIGRLTGGDFDGVDFNATSYNRGWIKITYIG